MQTKAAMHFWFGDMVYMHILKKKQTHELFVENVV
jgi:hypothetical protein